MGRPCIPAELRWPLAIMAVAGMLTVTVLSVVFASGAPLPGIDAWALNRPYQKPPLLYLALVLDRGGEPVGATLLTAMVAGACVLTRRWSTMVLVVIGPVTTVVGIELLKHLVGRTIHGGLSFPSGHTGFATALALVTAILIADTCRLGPHAAVLLLVALPVATGAAMAWAQVVLTAHYPTDTVGGFAFALAVVPSSAWGLTRAGGSSPGPADLGVGDRLPVQVRGAGAAAARRRFSSGRSNFS